MCLEGKKRLRRKEGRISDVVNVVIIERRRKK